MSLHLDPERHRSERFDEQVGPARIEPRAGETAALLATGSLICPSCELPLAPGSGVSAEAEMSCPFCDHRAPAQHFLRRDVVDTEANRVNLVARVEA